MRLLFFALVAATLALAGYYYFVDTLTLTEIADASEDRTAAFFAPLMDFDTGLTRWDLHSLSTRADDWRDRWTATESIPDLSDRLAEQKKILNEMLSDPAVSKITDRLPALGEHTARALLDMLSRR